MEAYSKRQAIESVFFVKLALCAKKSLAKNTGRSLERYRNRKMKIIFIQNKYDLNKNEMWFGCENGNLWAKLIVFYLDNENTHTCCVKTNLEIW